MPSKKKRISGATRAKRARESFVKHQKRSKAALKGVTTRRERAREGIYGKLEQRAQARRDEAALAREHARWQKIVEEQNRRIRDLEQQLKDEKRVTRVVKEVQEFDRYDKGEFEHIARKHRMNVREVYTLWLYH